MPTHSEEEVPDVVADDVVASGGALSVVQGWLGISNAAAILEQNADELQGEPDKPRPARLGLGAKFLSHNKAVALTGGVEKHLSKRMRQSAHLKNMPKEPWQPDSKRKRGGSRSDDSDDSEDGSMSRARAVSGRKKPGWNGSVGPPLPLIAHSGKGAKGQQQGTKKKSKKKKKGQAET